MKEQELSKKIQDLRDGIAIAIVVGLLNAFYMMVLVFGVVWGFK